MKKRIVLVQLGSPKSPQVSHVFSYLQKFLGDPRLIDFPGYLWKIILYLWVLPTRCFHSAGLYRRIWNGKSFPLVDYTYALKDQLQNQGHLVDCCFLLGSRNLKHVLDEYRDRVINDSSLEERWIIVPLFPQYSEATTCSVMDAFFHAIQKRTRIPSFEFLLHFHKSAAFIDNLANKINLCFRSQKFEHLLISFHGLPTRRIVVKKDPYYQQCLETFILLKERLEIEGSKVHLCFQSRLGPEQWLGPYTENILEELSASGVKKIGVVCPSFIADCLETVDEMGHELKKDAKRRGSELTLIPCLNDDKKFGSDFGSYLSAELEKRKELNVNQTELAAMPEATLKSPPLDGHAKSHLKIVFLTLFMDLIGFSIIFPLFPALAKHYMLVDPENIFLQGILKMVSFWAPEGAQTMGHTSIVLFGGALGALYSFLQFIASPIWGSLSDRIGRKPVLLISVFFLAASYFLWIFSGSFTLLILARLIGGIMGGNISTATAVVADVTPVESRSRGMAVIGIAFATGFIIGPAMGGLFSLIDLRDYFPSLTQYGLNPFSMPALVAFLLSAVNFLFIVFKFKETLPKEKRGHGISYRSMNPIKILTPLPFKGVNGVNIGHFLFLLAFSGMEFTLTFLALERFSYTPMDNGMMFIFIGVVIALTQGGYVRRKAAIIGERKMAVKGLILIIPGLLCIGLSQWPWLMFIGLFFLAVGSSCVIPTLTALVTLYTPAEEQGRSIGIFRSLGALARVIGPLLASVLYWRFGSTMPYIAGAIFLLIPIAMVLRLPEPKAI